VFRKYEKTLRAHVPGVEVESKFRLPKDELKLLLAGRIYVEEKLDGANVGIIRHKQGLHLQKRGSLVGPSEHEQFQFFHNWAQYQNYEKLMGLPVGYTVYGELLYAVHSIFYDRLPDWVLVFDIWSWKKAQYLDYPERQAFCAQYGLCMVPLLAEGYFRVEELAELVPEASCYGPVAEGMVLKRYRRKEYCRAKIVKPEFGKQLEESEHWTRQKVRTNQLAPRS
jgi:ATP-dependent RNA circularization protein (DNA/RNA ligase family)